MWENLMAGCSLLIKGGYFPNFQRWDPFHLILAENNAIVLSHWTLTLENFYQEKMFPRDFVTRFTSKRLLMILGIKKKWTVPIGKRREREREERKAAIPALQSGSANYERGGGSKRGFVAWRTEAEEREKEKSRSSAISFPPFASLPLVRERK